MNPFLIKILPLICATFVVTACSVMTDPNTPPRPVTIENAQESVPQTPHQAPISEPAPHDQNTLQSVSLGTTPINNEPIGGSLEKSMDSDDKIKLSRALDKAPGKTTSWTNNRTGIHYETTVIRKLVLKDNPFCRVYRMVASRNNNTKELSGTACISADGSWHPM